MADVVLRPGQTTFSGLARDLSRRRRNARSAPATQPSRLARERSRRSSPEASRSTASTPASASSASVRIDAGGSRHAAAQHRAVARRRRGRADAGAVARLMMALKLASLAQGASGVRPETVQLLEAMLARDVMPVVPAQGSVGASGDLAPLAHMAAAMIGVGEIFHAGERMPAARGAGAGRPAADRAWRQGRPGAAQRHAVLHRLCAGRAVRGRDAVPGRRWSPARCRPMRRAAPMRRSIRASTRCAAIADRSRRPRAARADGRQRDPRLASHRRRPRAGPRIACAASRR